MTKLFYKTAFMLLSMFFSVAAIAQGNDIVKSADETRGLLYSNGKIYVVVAVLVTILLGLIVYLISLDRKISKLEHNKE